MGSRACLKAAAGSRRSSPLRLYLASVHGTAGTTRSPTRRGEPHVRGQRSLHPLGPSRSRRNPLSELETIVLPLAPSGVGAVGSYVGDVLYRELDRFRPRRRYAQDLTGVLQ